MDACFWTVWWYNFTIKKKIQDSSTFASHLSATLLPLEQASGWAASGASDHNSRACEWLQNKNASWAQAPLSNSTTQGGVFRVRHQKKVCRKTNDGREVRYSSYRLWFPESLVWDVGALGRGFDTDRLCVWAAIPGSQVRPEVGNLCRVLRSGCPIATRLVRYRFVPGTQIAIQWWCTT